MLSTSQFDAYGNQLSNGDDTDPFGYGAQWGYYTDIETNLILCTHRYYDPVQGRFLKRDPSGYAGGINLYSYCGGNPVNRMDPSGLDSLKGGDPLSSWADNTFLFGGFSKLGLALSHSDGGTEASGSLLMQRGGSL